jgi:integrase
MARQLAKFSARQVQRKGHGWHDDGGGLYLRVNRDGRYWYFRWGAAGGKYISLGPTHTTTLERAREKARACRELVLDGRDPKTERAAIRATARLEAAKRITFAQAADRFFENHRAAWRSEKHAREWRTSLKTYADPVLGALSVAAIDTSLVLKALEPIWQTRTVTAGRVRQRIESVLDFAKARGLRDGDNPARWRGHLENLLPPPRKIAPVKHYAALPYADGPAFMAKLRAVDDVPARCLEFLILTATRTNEARGAVWDDISGDTWTIPAARMKRGKAHRVPLSRAALAMVKRMPADGGFIFPGRNGAIGDTALGDLLAELRDGCTVHGFRSAFRDWAAEQTNFPREVAELALAHAVGSATERAYARGDLLEQRRKLMEAWARYCAGVAPSAAVVPMRERRHG